MRVARVKRLDLGSKIYYASMLLIFFLAGLDCRMRLTILVVEPMNAHIGWGEGTILSPSGRRGVLSPMVNVDSETTTSWYKLPALLNMMVH